MVSAALPAVMAVSPGSAVATATGVPSVAPVLPGTRVEGRVLLVEDRGVRVSGDVAAFEGAASTVASPAVVGAAAVVGGVVVEGAVVGGVVVEGAVVGGVVVEGAVVGAVVVVGTVVVGPVGDPDENVIGAGTLRVSEDDPVEYQYAAVPVRSMAATIAGGHAPHDGVVRTWGAAVDS